MSNKLYHVTSWDNKDSILMNGLLVCPPSRNTDNAFHRIYLCDYYYDLSDFVENLDRNLAVFEVIERPNDLQRDTEFPDFIEGEFVYTEHDIPVDNIKLHSKLIYEGHKGPSYKYTEITY